ncbi:hypothetical protein ABFX02_04G226950 [Erythranthe guttata]
MDNFERDRYHEISKIPKEDTKKRNRDELSSKSQHDDDGGRIDEETTRRRLLRLKRRSRWDETPTPTPTPTPPPTSFLTQTPYMYMPTPEDKAMRTSSWDDGTMYDGSSNDSSSCWVCQFLALSPNHQH